MTRAHFKRPVWTWFCDRCGKTSGDLATEQQGLPAPDEMRALGWFIAETWGDRCPECVEAERPAATPATRPSLAGIEKRAAAATPGPWRADVETRGDAVVWGPDGAFISNAQGEPHWLPAPDGSERQVQFDADRRDAAFIADARTDVPVLVAALRAVLALHAEHWAWVNRRQRTCTCIACDTVRAIATHLDLTDLEGDPT